MDISFISGFLASSVHVLTGPDHLAAVAPITAKEEKKHWKIGLFWGLGHLAGMVLLGGLFLFFKDYIPVKQIASVSESSVGFVLIFLGVWIIYKLIKKSEHSHKHLHIIDEKVVLHNHKHTHPHLHKEIKEKKKSSGWLIFGIGTLHGFAGVTHLLILLPVLLLEDFLDASLYLSGFALGTLLSMVLFSLTIGLVRNNLTTSRLLKNFQLGLAIISITVGVFWVMSN